MQKWNDSKSWAVEVEFLSLKLTAVTLICIILCSLNSQESMSYTNHLFNSNSNNIGTMSIKGVKSVILIVVAFWIFIGWHTVYADYAACFNSEKDYKQFLASNSTGYITSFPCPANDTLLNQNIPNDESGKWYTSRKRWNQLLSQFQT